MLKQLYIKNFTLIDTLDIHFNAGFSVITGETGAGKSIIIGAINLLLGQRADVKNIKTGSKKCTIEAHFDIMQYGLQAFFEQNDIDFDPNDCILRRELNSSGKSRAFINDSPVSLVQLRELGQMLIDIHSQHQNLLLNREDFQLDVIDTIAQNKALLVQYKESYAAYKTARSEVELLRREINENRKNEDYLRFQYKELVEANLKSGLQEELEQENDTLSHVEEIKTSLYAADKALNWNDTEIGTLDKIKEASRTIDSLANIYPNIKEVAARLESCYIELKDISQEISSEVSEIDFNPTRLEQINSQLDSIYSLEKKYHASDVDELIRMRDDIEVKLNNIDNSDGNLEELLKREQKLLAECKKNAVELTLSRKEAAVIVEKEMCNRLIPLGIPNVCFSINMEEIGLCLSGQDRVSFFFSANKSTFMQPIAQVASGGEIARVMLALKAMISGAMKMPTIIFDEVDAGVSGKIAEKMADIMLEMSNTDRQVICITHLPQIAAKGMTHYKVYKEETDNGTVSTMERLTAEERVEEIAQMLSGTKVSDAATRNARELLRLK